MAEAQVQTDEDKVFASDGTITGSPDVFNAAWEKDEGEAPKELLDAGAKKEEKPEAPKEEAAKVEEKTEEKKAAEAPPAEEKKVEEKKEEKPQKKSWREAAYHERRRAEEFRTRLEQLQADMESVKSRLNQPQEKEEDKISDPLERDVKRLAKELEEERENRRLSEQQRIIEENKKVLVDELSQLPNDKTFKGIDLDVDKILEYMDVEGELSPKRAALALYEEQVRDNWLKEGRESAARKVAEAKEAAKVNIAPGSGASTPPVPTSFERAFAEDLRSKMEG